MAFFISYPLSALGHDISPRADRLEGWYHERGLIKGMIWKMTCYDLFIIYFNRGFPEINEVACNKLTNIDGEACNNIPEAVNKRALSAR